MIDNDKKPAIVVKNKVIRFPTSLKSVIDLLNRMLWHAKNTQMRRIVIFTLDKEGQVRVSHNSGSNIVELLGIIEKGKRELEEIWDEDE